MENQTTLDTFFNSKENGGKEYQINKFFYLDWSKDKNEKIHAQWLITKPTKINFSQKINCDKLKKGLSFTLCGYFEDDEYQFTKEKRYKNVAFLRSHLKRNIQMMDDQKAIPTVIHLMQSQFRDALEHILQIHLCDTFLHTGSSVLIWIMIALKNKFKIQKCMVEWVLGFVYIICKTKKKDTYKKGNNINYKNIQQELSEYKKFEKEQESMMYSFHFVNIFYEIECIEQVMETWKRRFVKKNIQMNAMRIRSIQIYVNELKIEDWDLSAIHDKNVDNFLSLLFKKFPSLEADGKTKDILDQYNTNMNVRDKTNEPSNEWNMIRKYVRKMQYYFIVSRS